MRQYQIQGSIHRRKPFFLIAFNQKMVSDDGYFTEFGIVSDGSPLIANAEAFQMTKVHKDTGAILLPLVHFELYIEPLNGVKHVNHFIAAIKRKCDGAALDPSNWLFDTQDGCATNGAAVDHINNKTDYLVCKDTCCSHTFCFCGKAFDTQNLNALLSKDNICFRYKGKLRYRFREKYHESPIKSGGNRWWNRWEHRKQMSEFGIQHMIDHVFKWGVKNNASE